MHLVARDAELARLLEFLRLLAVDQPVLIAVDDVQWLDVASERALGFALRRLDAVPVSVLATRRGTGGPLPLGIDELAPAVRQDRVPVGPMPATDLTALLEQRFGGRCPGAWCPGYRRRWPAIPCTPSS